MSKKMKMMALVLSLAMIALLFVGCGGGEKKQPADSGQSSGQGGGNQQASDKSGVNQTGFPIVNEQITLKILKQKAAHEVPIDQMDVFKEYEKMTNIHIEWDNPPSESFKERYNIVMASGDLPDAIMDMPAGDVLKYAQMGVIIPLNDLIDKYAPNLKAWMEKRPEIKKAITYPDGKIYYLPMFDEFPVGNNPLYIREDWLKKLNLQSPVTTDDWYNVLKAFKTQDPNSNGKADEIPFSGNGIGAARSLVVGWGVVDGFYSDPKDGGKIHYGPVESRYKEGLMWINQLYKEGLIDQEIATNDEKAYQGKMAQNIVGASRGALGGHIMSFNTTLPKQIPGFRVMGTAPLKGPYGDQIHPWLDQSPRSGTIALVITNKNKYPEATIRWADYFYSREGAILMCMGIEGKHYKMVNGQPVYTDYILKNPDGLSPKQAIGTMSIAQSTGPYVLIKDEPDQLDDPAVKETKAKYIAPFIEESKKYVLPGALPFEQQDDELRRQIMADVQTYVDEQITKFILGQEPLTNWDNYVKKVKDMGIDKVIAVYQKSFDAWNKK